jgi:hypothetical protein
MSANKMEWNEPGVGVCHVWQEGSNSWGYSTTGIWGHALSFEEAKAELEAYIAEKGGL